MTNLALKQYLPARTVCVVGTGAGTLAALELAQQGLDVALVGAAPRILSQATGRHGRRLHLGEHYSGDAAFRPNALNTGQRCTLGAIALVDRFPNLIRGPGRWWQLITEDSMTPPDQYLDYCKGLRGFYAEIVGLDAAVAGYFGPPGERHRELGPAEYGPHVAPGVVALGIESREAVIDTTAFRRMVRRRLDESAGLVHLYNGHEVVDIERLGDATFEIALRTDCGDLTFLRCESIVNASWEHLHRLSRMVKPTFAVEATTRLRMLSRAQLPVSLRAVPSMYFHRGVHGNHTNVDGREALVLAEAVCNLAFDTGLAPPKPWDRLMKDPLAPADWVAGFATHAPSSVANLMVETDGPSAIGATVAALPGPEKASAVLQVLSEIATDGAVSTDIRAGRIQHVLAEVIRCEYARYVPAFSTAPTLALVPNVVITPGDARMWDPSSAVHSRDATVYEVVPGFVNMYTGKFTYAALVSQEAAARVIARRRGEDVSAVRRRLLRPVVREYVESIGFSASKDLETLVASR